MPDFWAGTPIERCVGELDVGNGRIKYSCPNAKYRFDAALSDVRDATLEDGIAGSFPEFGRHLVIRLANGKTNRRLEFVATDRLGQTDLPLALGARPPVDSLLDAILQAKGK